MRTRRLVSVAVALAVVGLLFGSFRAVAGPDTPAVPPADPCIGSC